MQDMHKKFSKEIVVSLCVLIFDNLCVLGLGFVAQAHSNIPCSPS